MVEMVGGDVVKKKKRGDVRWLGRCVKVGTLKPGDVVAFMWSSFPELPVLDYLDVDGRVAMIAVGVVESARANRTIRLSRVLWSNIEGWEEKVSIHRQGLDTDLSWGPEKVWRIDERFVRLSPEERDEVMGVVGLRLNLEYKAGGGVGMVLPCVKEMKMKATKGKKKSVRSVSVC